jgi:hypothetical protein
MRFRPKANSSSGRVHAVKDARVEQDMQRREAVGVGDPAQRVVVAAHRLARRGRRIEEMPSCIQGFAAHQPVTPAVETIRSLLLGTPAGASPWQALAWCAAILVGSITLAAVLFRRRTN